MTYKFKTIKNGLKEYSGEFRNISDAFKWLKHEKKGVFLKKECKRKLILCREGMNKDGRKINILKVY